MFPPFTWRSKPHFFSVEVYTHRGETCLLFRLKQPCRWPRWQFLWRPRRWRHPQCTPHKRPLSSTSLLLKLWLMPHQRPSLISSRQHQLGPMLHQRPSSKSTHIVVRHVCFSDRIQPCRWPRWQFLWRPRRWRHPQCAPHKRPLSSTSPQYQVCLIRQQRPSLRTSRQYQRVFMFHQRPSSNMSRLLPQCTRRQRLWWRTSRPLQLCTRHKRLWWSTSRPLQQCTRHKRLW